MYTSPRLKWFFFWSQRLFSISLLGFYAAITLETGSSNAAPIAKLNDWRFYPEAAQLEFTLSAGTKPQYFYLSQPPRLVIDLPDTKLGYVVTKQSYPGAIQRVRVSQLNATITRIVLDLAAGTFIDPKQVKLQPVSRNNSTRWVLRPFTSSKNLSIQPANIQPRINSLPPNSYNSYPQTPTNLNPNPNSLQLPSTLPPITTNQQQPYITVPPLTSNNPDKIQGSILPPANFPNQPGNLNNFPPVASPNFPIPTIPSTPNYQSNEVQIPVIEFGQPLPKP
ncbi:AMIN domain-containing protein [Nostoc sp. LEGE 06077]|uniref:AMIN domain-containing protein n=1 Tax=Nostoc sp. LEGE 06077 TaxID=915325 RepID=UPI00187FAF38|nr:AMIN domain-containing protein [Nostoc sp. LEGE 06077]MBE9205481.1 AMIN domain-containing protein [Nostoc sp. LEGE 06077]